MRFLIFAKVIVCLLFTCLSEPSVAQHSAESRSLGNVSFRDGFAYFPSAEVISGDRHEIAINHTNHYLTNELKQTTLAYQPPMKSMRLVCAFTEFGYKHYRLHTLRVAAAKQLASRFQLGTSVAYNWLQITGDEETRQAFSLSLDATFNINHRYQLYAKAQIPKFLKGNGFYLQDLKKAIVGVNMQLAQKSTCLAEFHFQESFRDIFHIGFDQEVANVNIRLGCSGIPITPCYGIGLNIKWLKINASGQWKPTLGHSFACDIILYIKNNKEKNALK